MGNKTEIKKADKIGLCFGVKRALEMLDKVIIEKGSAETLGAIAHNQYLVEKLAARGVRLARDINDIKSDTIVISSHGVSPQVMSELEARRIRVVDTTCPFVHRAQLVARRLARADFQVIIYGDASHTEVKGILGWAEGKGTATLDDEFAAKFQPTRRIGVLSQTTQIASNFTEFVKRLIVPSLTKDTEIRIVDTICHDTRERQDAALKLAGKVDLLYVIGGRNSANTNRLVELCSTSTEACLIESAADIEQARLQGKRRIGLTAGASTPEKIVDEVIIKIEALTP